MKVTVYYLKETSTKIDVSDKFRKLAFDYDDDMLMEELQDIAHNVMIMNGGYMECKVEDEQGNLLGEYY